MRQFSFLLILIAIIASHQVARAALPPKAAPLKLEEEIPTPVDWSQIKAVNPEPILTEKDVEQIIPTNIGNSSDSKQVSSQILDHSVSHFFTGSAFQKTSLGQTTSSVQKAFQQDFHLGSKKSGSIEHKFNFQLEAFQQKAILHYTGFLDANVQYRISENDLVFELIKPLRSQTELVLNSKTNPQQDSRQISMRWNW